MIRPVILVTALTLCGLSSAFGQATRVSGWTVRISPAVDLWYHALAVVQLPAIHGIPRDAQGYVQRIAEMKRSAGIFPTELDERAEDVRDWFARHESFEALHLMPTLFPDATPERMIDGLRRAVDGDDPGAARPDVAGGMVRVQTIFGTSRERNDFRRFLNLVEAEWSTFYASHWRAINGDHDRRAAAAESVIAELVASSIVTTLSAWRVQAGIVFLSRPVGPAGRIAIGDPANPSDNVAVVRLTSDTTYATAAASLIRELCVPPVTALVRTLGFGRFDPYVAAQASGRGAVLCGARVIEDQAPHFAQQYRNAFVGTVADMEQAEFEAVFAVDPALDARIDELVGRRSR